MQKPYLKSFFLFQMIALITACATKREQPKIPNNAPIVIENAHYRIEVARPHGVIIRLRDKAGDIELIREPRLASNFKFTLPIRGPTAWQSTEGNYVLGERQRLTGVQKTDSSVELSWAGPLTSTTGGSYDADVTMRIALVEDRIEFRMTVDNRSQHEIG